VPGADIVAAAQAVLRARYAAGRNGLGLPVHRGQVIAMLQALAGVVAVELTALHLADQPPDVVAVLPCHPARWDGGRALPAQLLLTGPVTLTAVPVTGAEEATS